MIDTTKYLRLTVNIHRERHPELVAILEGLKQKNQASAWVMEAFYSKLGQRPHPEREREHILTQLLSHDDNENDDLIVGL